MHAVILAGGKGTRLHPLTTNVPKPMVPLFDRPVMEHSIKLLAEHGIEDIIVTVSYAAKDVMRYFGDGSRWGVRIRYSVEHEPLGTAGAVKQVQGQISGTFVVVSADAVTDIDLTAAITQHKAAGAIATIMLSEVDDPTSFGLVQHDEAGKVTRFLEKPRADEVFTNTVSTGIYVLEPEALSCIPYFQAFDFARDLFPRMLRNQEPVYGFDLSSYWCDVGSVVHYRNAHFDALRGRLKLQLPATCIGNDVWLGQGVDIHSSVTLASPLFLGSGVTIRRGAEIGERTVIGAKSIVDEGAHVSRSVIGGNSLVGRNARISDCIVGSSYNLAENETIQDRILVAADRYEHVPDVVTTTVQHEAQTLVQSARQEAEQKQTA